MAEAKTTYADVPFFTNYAQILMLIASDNTLRMRELAVRIGITERAVQRIVEELVSAGYLTISKSGRRNAYDLHKDLRVHHPLLRDLQVEDLINLRHQTNHPDMLSPHIH